MMEYAVLREGRLTLRYPYLEIGKTSNSHHALDLRVQKKVEGIMERGGMWLQRGWVAVLPTDTAEDPPPKHVEIIRGLED